MTILDVFVLFFTDFIFIQIIELKNRFDSLRDQIKQLPGIDYNKDEQLQKLELLQNQLKLKQGLVNKYKNLQL